MRDPRAGLRWLLPEDPERRRRRDRILLVLGLVLAAVLVARAARKQDGVLARNQEWGARFLERQDPYEDVVHGGRLHGPYPPSYAIVCAPLSILPETPARLVWAVAQVGALAASFLLLRRWLARGWPQVAPHASVVYAAALVLTSRYILRDMAGGGGNLLYATAVLWGIEHALAGRSLAGGLLVALPLALKPNLAPLVLALPLRGRWPALGVAVVATAALAWAPSAWFGAEAWAGLWRRWIADVAAFARVEDLSRADLVPAGFPVDDGMNQSLRAASGRVEAALRDAGGSARPPSIAALAARVASLVLMGVAAWTCWRARGARGELLGLLALVPASLLASPITWKAHHATLLLLFGLLAATAIERRRWSALAAFLGLYWFACGLLSEEIVGKAGKQALQSASVVTWATIVLLAVAVALARRADRTSTG